MKFYLTAASAAMVILAACAQQEEPPLYVQPSFDKRGNAICPAGYAAVTTESGDVACAPAS